LTHRQYSALPAEHTDALLRYAFAVALSANLG
jgi:hypothetical protein